jgi:hypothetical protein
MPARFNLPDLPLAPRAIRVIADRVTARRTTATKPSVTPPSGHGLPCPRGAFRFAASTPIV